jgi:thiol-disulfide isomerase/thioredoxin
VRFLDFSLQDLEQAPVSLGQIVGKKPVLLLFWAGWCPICREKVPVLNRIHREGAVAVVAVNVKESPKKVKAAVRSLGIRYPVLLDTDGSVARKYKVPGIPAYIVIDTAGRIVYDGNALPGRIENDGRTLSFRFTVHSDGGGRGRDHPFGSSVVSAGRRACRCVSCHGDRQEGTQGAKGRCRCAPSSGDSSPVSAHIAPRWEFLAAAEKPDITADRSGWCRPVSPAAPKGWSANPPVPPPRSEISC